MKKYSVLFLFNRFLLFMAFSVSFAVLPVIFSSCVSDGQSSIGRVMADDGIHAVTRSETEIITCTEPETELEICRENSDVKNGNSDEIRKTDEETGAESYYSAETMPEISSADTDKAFNHEISSADADKSSDSDSLSKKDAVISEKKEDQEPETISDERCPHDNNISEVSGPETENKNKSEFEIIKSRTGGNKKITANKGSHVFHTCDSCPYLLRMSEENKEVIFYDSEEELKIILENGYCQCRYCEKHEDKTDETDNSDKRENPVNADTDKAEETDTSENNISESETPEYKTAFVNKNTKTFHLDKNCRAVKSMKAENIIEVRYKNVSELLEAGYKPCGICAGKYRN